MATAVQAGLETELERVRRTARCLNDPVSREVLSRYRRDLESESTYRLREDAPVITI